jgi:hypothetical protein
VFQGTDGKKFWQRAEDQNKETADLFDELGYLIAAWKLLLE